MSSKLGFFSLIALVISSMIGAGVFSLPQNMAAVAGSAAVTLAWLITAVGMLFLALALQYLSLNKPNVDSGIFGYAKHGFGDLIGFCSAWGYWLSAMLANVSYLVIVFSTLGMIFDTPNLVMFGSGNTITSILFASLFLWLVHILVLSGLKNAAFINLLATFIKIIPLAFFVICALFVFNWNTFILDFAGLHFGKEHSILSQVKATMLITVWAFIGVEGAIVLSGRARNRKNIGHATIVGLFFAILIYMLVTLLSMGIIKSTELAQYQNPSMAKVLASIVGPWGEYVISTALIISVCGSFLTWTLLASEVPYLCAKEKLFPKSYLKSNYCGSPVKGLMLTSIGTQISLIIVMYAGSTYNTLLLIASEMILIPYFLVSTYVLQFSIKQRNNTGLFIGLCATLYSVWLFYASGLDYLIMSSVLYLPGFYFYCNSRREQSLPFFKNLEYFGIGALLLVAIIGVNMMRNGNF
ncbi:arginine/ornithine antiporter [Candidatus Photodesmus blepharus]|uniref:Arginine/ornithine antiporter n=1 Tax=Candidatus Photodesmus blepharonis TaxID=1179155 RepID=A0A084CPA1_9GAMM|nr:basic amino acid/polyamine antiporter [Candidatus Photodesmus blepharus]KEY91630.1 arginine/ornithine antiporter [Candidatus Photodesmus blepharus]